MTMEKPDPGEVEAVDQNRYVHQRDENGDLIPIADVIEVGGEWKRIEHLPATKGFLTKLQSKFGERDEVDLHELDDIMGEWYVDPEIENWEDVDAELYFPMINLMTEKLVGGMDDTISDEIQEAIDERQGEGN